MPHPALRLALIADTPFALPSILRFLQTLQQDPRYELTRLFLQPGGASTRISPLFARKPGVDRENSQTAPNTLNQKLLRLIHAIEEKVLGRAQPAFSGFFDCQDITPYFPEVTELPQPEAEGLQGAFDILLNFSAQPLPEFLFRCGTLGVLQLTHARNAHIHGEPEGFWAVAQQQDSTPFQIERLSGPQACPELLFEGHFATSYYWTKNQAQLYGRTPHYLKVFLDKIASSRCLPAPIARGINSQTPHPAPNTLQIIRYFVRRIWPLALDVMARLPVLWRIPGRISRDVKHCWGIATHAGKWADLPMHQARLIPNPKNRFLADPFLIEEQGQRYCFVEDYDYPVAKGCISAYQIEPDGAWTRLGEVINEPHHMSFPYLFRYQDQIYMCPEISGSREIRVYRATDFPMTWEHSHTLMHGVSSVDTLLFEHEGRWWMLTNPDSTGSGDHCIELALYYADQPLTQTWTPHPMNPIRVDARYARNGGMIQDASGLYRVAQKQGYNTYGRGLSVFRITELSPTRYREELVTDAGPFFHPDIIGTHHLHAVGGQCVFDYYGQRKSFEEP